MDVMKAVDAGALRTDHPEFAPGDTVQVHLRVVEGNTGPGLPGSADESGSTSHNAARYDRFPDQTELKRAARAGPVASSSCLKNT